MNFTKRLKNIIQESIRDILSNRSRFGLLDISDIPIEDLRRGYRDLRLATVSVMYGNRFSSLNDVKETVGDIMPPDEISENLIRKYDLPQTFVAIREHYHNICVYVVVARLGINDKLIEKDMLQNGYFLGFVQPPQTVEGMEFQVLQFEPESQLQDDITDIVKQEYDCVYHWTPIVNFESISKNGLCPTHRNSLFNYPPRIYLIEGDCTDRQLFGLGQSLCSSNQSSDNNGEYVLLKVNISGLDEKIRFFHDPNSEIGIYTEQKIPNQYIEFINKVQFVTSLKCG